MQVPKSRRHNSFELTESLEWDFFGRDEEDDSHAAVYHASGQWGLRRIVHQNKGKWRGVVCTLPGLLTCTGMMNFGWIEAAFAGFRETTTQPRAATRERYTRSEAFKWQAYIFNGESSHRFSREKLFIAARPS